MIGDRRVRVLAVDARPGEGDDQALRRARLYLDAATGDLVGARLHRRMASLLFSETSDVLVMLHPVYDGWLPRLARFDTTLDALFTDERRFVLARRYSDFQPAAAALPSP